MSNVNASNPAAAAAQLDTSRPRFTFRVPEETRSLPGDPSTVTLQMVTAGEEAKIMESGGKTIVALRYSLVEADGKPISWDNGGRERFVEALSPKVRALLGLAYGKIHMPSDKSVDDFLGTMVTNL